MTARKRQVARIYADGLEQIDRLGLVTHDPDRFFPLITLRCGVGTGAYGGITRDKKPYIYIGTRCEGFSKENDLRNLRDHKQTDSDWKTAADHARRGEWLFVEYSHIHDDPEIGGFVSDNSDDHIRALIAHELAHAVHWWLKEQGADIDKVTHGAAWQKIYRALRREWVNPLMQINQIKGC